MLYDFFVAPFVDFMFMRRALVAAVSLALSCSPIGVMLVLRRMSLMGDALSHSILPGVALAYLFAGLSLPAMGLGGLLAGICVAALATWVSRHTILREDASFVSFYLIALAGGTLIIAAFGRNVDLLHILFGQILGVTPAALVLIGSSTTLTLVTLAIIYRPLLIECIDPGFMQSLDARGGIYHVIFMLLVVCNMVAAFQALGTLLAMGIMMLPAVAARFWGRSVWSMFIGSTLVALVGSYIGLLASYHGQLPAGPCIILVLGGIYLLGLLSISLPLRRRWA